MNIDDRRFMMRGAFYYLRRGGNVFVSVCVSVCQCAKYLKKVMNRLLIHPCPPVVCVYLAAWFGQRPYNIFVCTFITPVFEILGISGV